MGHGYLPKSFQESGGWWACDYPERKPEPMVTAFQLTICKPCLIAACASFAPGRRIHVASRQRVALGLALDQTWLLWSELLPLLAEYHGLPLRMLAPA
jgi:hypothetical protein